MWLRTSSRYISVFSLPNLRADRAPVLSSEPPILGEGGPSQTQLHPHSHSVYCLAVSSRLDQSDHRSVPPPTPTPAGPTSSGCL